MAWWTTRRSIASARAIASVSCRIRSSTVESKRPLFREREGKTGQGPRGTRSPGGSLDHRRPALPPAQQGRGLGRGAGREQAAARRAEPGHGAAGGRDQGGRRSRFFSPGDRRGENFGQEEEFDLWAGSKGV